MITIKNKVFKKVFYAVLALMMMSFYGDTVLKRIISDSDHTQEFYIKLEQPKKFKTDRTYHWFRSGKIHTSVGDVGGQVLHETYVKFDVNRNLLQKGDFDDGLKNGLWKTWATDGNLIKAIEYKQGILNGTHITYTEDGAKQQEGTYRNGLRAGVWKTWSETGRVTKEERWELGKRQGAFKSYDEEGKLQASGKYSKGLKHGKWIDHSKQDTVFYKKGKVIDKEAMAKEKEEKKKKPSFFQRLFKKKDKKEKPEKEQNEKKTKKQQ